MLPDVGGEHRVCMSSIPSTGAPFPRADEGSQVTRAKLPLRVPASVPRSVFSA